jgi:glycosyltransferase involved in cell wall biosynthesis
MEPLGVAVVIPVLNEGASIAAVIGEIPRDVVREIIVVDGGSSDGTAEIAAAAGARVIQTLC